MRLKKARVGETFTRGEEDAVYLLLGVDAENEFTGDHLKERRATSNLFVCVNIETGIVFLIPQEEEVTFVDVELSYKSKHSLSVPQQHQVSHPQQHQVSHPQQSMEMTLAQGIEKGLKPLLAAMSPTGSYLGARDPALAVYGALPPGADQHAYAIGVDIAKRGGSLADIQFPKGSFAYKEAVKGFRAGQADG